MNLELAGKVALVTGGSRGIGRATARGLAAEGARVEETLPMALELLGDTQVMYASDYPHWDAMTPWTVKIIAERGDLTEDAKRKILGENAARFYGIA